MKRTHCKNGHELVGENVYVVPSSGSRQCRICKVANDSSYRARNRERIRERKREYNERTDYMRKWHECNREHEAKYRKQYRPRELELRRSKYAEDYAKPARQAKRETDRQRKNALARARWQRNKETIRARTAERNRQIVEAIGIPRNGHYTPAEDLIIRRDDLTVIEKCFILQRAPRSVQMRRSYLSDRTQARLASQREQRREYNRNYREANRERLAEAGRRWRAENAQKCRAKSRDYYERNREEIIRKVAERSAAKRKAATA